MSQNGVVLAAIDELMFDLKISGVVMVTLKSIFDFLLLGISIKVLKSGLDLVILRKFNDKKAHKLFFSE